MYAADVTRRAREERRLGSVHVAVNRSPSGSDAARPHRRPSRHISPLEGQDALSIGFSTLLPFTFRAMRTPELWVRPGNGAPPYYEETPDGVDQEQAVRVFIHPTDGRSQLTPEQEATAYRAVLQLDDDKVRAFAICLGAWFAETAGGDPKLHVHVARYIPPSLLLPHCDLVVTHGGHNTVLAAIDAGLPLVVIPFVGDQPDNARRCAALGLGQTVGPAALTPEAVRDAVRTVLREPGYRADVQRLRAEARALPGPERGVRLLERLVGEKMPLAASA
jgi:UDP:flavonoid glycosyltransferase YjiC (YdhE family)